MRAVDDDIQEEIEEAEAIEKKINSPRRWSQAIILCLSAFGLQRLASFAPELIERFYSSYLYQMIGRVIAIINKPFAYSLAEIGLVALVITLVIWLLWLAQKTWNGYLSFFDLLTFLIYRGLWASGVLLLLFLLLWGLNYHRQGLANSLNLEGRQTRPGELEEICSLMITQLNSNYEAARLGQAGITDRPAPPSRPALYDSLEKSYQNLNLLGRASQSGLGPPKPLLLSPLLSRLGISGIYSPFTGEANYNDEAPACDLPFVIAHEKAHQRGYAREDEANFIGFLACINASEPFIRYSGYLQAMPRVMNVLATTNEEIYRTLVARIGEGARTDLQGRAAFWRLRENRVLGEVARRTNNTYLRANHVRSGIANYDEVTALILNYFLTYPNGVPVRAVPTVATQAATRATERPVVTSTPTPSPTPAATPAFQTEISAGERRPAPRNSFIP